MHYEWTYGDEVSKQSGYVASYGVNYQIKRPTYLHESMRRKAVCSGQRNVSLPNFYISLYSQYNRKRIATPRWSERTGTYACHLHISVGHLNDGTIRAHDHNYLQQKETTISIIIYVQNLRVSGSEGEVMSSKCPALCPTNGKVINLMWFWPCIVVNMWK